jgi:hypothetical protein
MDEKTALSIVREDHDEGEYEFIEESVDDGHQKHDATNYYHIVLRKSDNTHWKIGFTCSYNYGLDKYSVYVHQVEKKEVVKVVWVVKK